MMYMNAIMFRHMWYMCIRMPLSPATGTCMMLQVRTRRRFLHRAAPFARFAIRIAMHASHVSVQSGMLCVELPPPVVGASLILG